MARAARTERRKNARAPKPPPRWPALLALFAGALAIRVLFYQATPGADWPHSPFFKGDAVVWLQYALALERGRPFELDLPLRPPGVAYLIALVWDGRRESLDALRLLWLAMGALVPPALFAIASRQFGLLVGWLAGAGAAASTGLILLSSSLNNETPYLLLLLASIALFDRLRDQPAVARIALWSVLHALACLFRVEHILFYALSLGLLVLAWRRPVPDQSARARWMATLTAASLSLAFFAGPLLPWHLSAWSAVRRFNTAPPPAEAEAAVRRSEERLGRLTWEPEAQQRREQLPAFARATASVFVAATAAHRGQRRVRGEDFGALQEAFGYEPRPLAAFPFVAGYGPLNFALANAPQAGGGFDRSRLQEPPPLAGGAQRYPPDLVRGLPPPDLVLTYPPHLRLYNEGYAIGLRWMRENPGAFLGLAARKLAIFWSGAALGFTGYGLPVGIDGLRRTVDMVVPEDGLAVRCWRLLVLALAIAGLVAGWRRPPLRPWLLFLASKLVVTVAFFGYARQGALVVPVVLLLAALALERWLLRGPLAGVAARPAVAGAVLLAAAVAVEAVRAGSPPAVFIDGAAVSSSADPVPLDVHRDHRVEVR